MATPALPHALILAGGLGRRMVADSAGEGRRMAADDAGEGRRMAGYGAGETRLPKPLVPLAGRPLIAHVIARMEPQSREIWINANADQAAYATFGCPIIADTLPGYPGPLAGVLVGLERLAEVAPGASLLTVPADTPFLPADLSARLTRRHDETGSVVCAGSGGQRHPVIALWPATVRAALRQSLEQGRLKVGLLLDTLGAVTENWDTTPDDPFFNVNTPEDLAIAEFRRTARE